MKKLMCIFVVALTLSPLVAQAEQITVTVKGLVCTFCAQGIKKSFMRDDHVKNIAVDMETKKVTIETKGSSTISDEALRSTIKDAGFEVIEIKREPDA